MTLADQSSLARRRGFRIQLLSALRGYLVLVAIGALSILLNFVVWGPGAWSAIVVFTTVIIAVLIGFDSPLRVIDDKERRPLLSRGSHISYRFWAFFTALILASLATLMVRTG